MTNGSHEAFACCNADGQIGQPGLTKREYFAAMAMQGLLAQTSQDFGYSEGLVLAKAAVQQADALIEALNR